MVIKQLAAFLENKRGCLFAAADVLARNGINIRALSLSDTTEFGILRMIVDDPEKGREVLHAFGVTVKITEVLAVAMEDIPGGTLRALRLLSEQGVDVEYMYACVLPEGGAFMVMQVGNLSAGEKILTENGFLKAEIR